MGEARGVHVSGCILISDAGVAGMARCARMDRCFALMAGDCVADAGCFGGPMAGEGSGSGEADSVGN
jgi:hypothetical protein